MRKNTFAFLLLFLTISTAFGQEYEIQKSIAINLRPSIFEDPPTTLSFEIAHEWRLSEFFAIEAGAGIENSEEYSSIDEWVDFFDQIEIGEYSLRGKSKYLDGKLSGYFPVFYDDDDNWLFQIYASFYAGVANQSLSGEANFFDSDQHIINKADDRTQLFYGFDIGVWAALSDRFSAKFFIGGNSINFKKATRKMNQQLGNMNFEYPRLDNLPYYGFTLSYIYRKSKKK
nr:hypothetical protein [uncultured Draconibacterium sp.]